MNVLMGLVNRLTTYMTNLFTLTQTQTYPHTKSKQGTELKHFKTWWKYRRDDKRQE